MKAHTLTPRRPSNTQQELLNEFNNSYLEDNAINDSPQSGDATPTFDEPDDEGGTGNESGNCYNYLLRDIFIVNLILINKKLQVSLYEIYRKIPVGMARIRPMALCQKPT